MNRIYVAGSLKSPRPREIANLLRENGHEVFDDWHACGWNADKECQSYEHERGRSFREALKGRFATHGFEFDRMNMEACDIFILVLPAGKSAHMELMYCQGIGKQGIIYMDDEPAEWDLMYKFVDVIAIGEEELLATLATVIAAT